MMKSRIVALMMLAFVGKAGAADTPAGAPWVRPLDFSGKGWRGPSQVESAAGPSGGKAVAWTIRASDPQFNALKGDIAALDLKAAGIDLSAYDELTCDLYFEGSDAQPVITIREWPRPKTLSNWYAKMPHPLEQWLAFRCDLRLDDDGVALTPGYANGGAFPNGAELNFELRPLFLRFKGEPEWRRLRVANLRLLRYPVRIAFDKRDAVYGETATHLTTRYAISVTSRLDQPGQATIKADSGALKYFRAVFDESGAASLDLPLAAGETRVTHLTLSIPRRVAETLPALFAESVGLEAVMREVPGVVVRPLMGYREWRLWAAVPAFHLHRPRPAETMAFYRDIAKLYPEAALVSTNAVRAGESVLSRKHEVLTNGPCGYDQSYRCSACNAKPLEMLSLTRHRCRKCGKEFVDNETINAAYLTMRHHWYVSDVATLANAYQHSGDERFARKAIAILLDYADKYDKFVGRELRSTCNQTKLMGALQEAFVLGTYRGPIFESYHLIADSPSLGDAERRRIEYDFLLNSGTRMMRHGAQMNQRAEYFNCFGLAGLYTKHWAVAGEAIYGDQGFLSLFDDGFTEDGIAPEGGGYHYQTFGTMCRFASAMNRQGVNLYTQRFKRVFDGTLALSPLGNGGGAEYEAAYRMYRDSAYLPILRGVRKAPGVLTFHEGVVGLPDGPGTLDKASNLEGTGYLYLRRNAPGGHRCLAVNYGMQWERFERDKLHIKLFADGQGVSSQVGRITYGSPFSANMYPGFAHNVVTVDGQNPTEERVPLVGLVEEGALAAALFRVNADQPLYSGVRQWKLVAIAGDHFVTIDRLESDTPRLYAWHYYPAAKDQTIPLSMTATDAPPALAVGTLPEGSLGNCRVGVLGAKPLEVEFAPSNSLTLLAPAGAAVLDGRIMAGFGPKMAPFLRVAATTPIAEFAALYRVGKNAGATIEKLKAPSDVHVWRFDADGRSFLLGFNATGKETVVEGLPVKGSLIAREFLKP